MAMPLLGSKSKLKEELNPIRGLLSLCCAVGFNRPIARAIEAETDIEVVEPDPLSTGSEFAGSAW